LIKFWGIAVAKYWTPDTLYKAVTQAKHEAADEVGTMLESLSDSTLDEELMDLTNGKLSSKQLAKAAFVNCSWW
jgi:hypothetical protein